ncbi:MAG: hypothetical protein RL180_200 [Pseudomonadota bacterium]|jgi:3-phytase
MSRLLLPTLITLLCGIGLSACNDDSSATSPTIEPLMAAAETANESSPADMDDPAVWLHPTDRSKSLIVAAAKLGGLRVYDLNAQLITRLPAATDATGKIVNRFNNVDVQYDFNLNGTRVDLVVASDRLQDKLRIWKINPQNLTQPLVDITSPSISRNFPQKTDKNDRQLMVDNPNNGKNTSYGLALYRDQAQDRLYAVVNQNNEAILSQFELVAQADGTVSTTPVKTFKFPYVYQGQDLTQEDDNDPAKDFSPQFEGMAVDQQTGVLYAANEDVGLFRVNLKTGVAETTPFYDTVAFDSTSKLARDAEGVSIYYGKNGTGYLVVSSQGNGHGEAPNHPNAALDDTFAVFDRAGTQAYLGSFSILANPNKNIDAVQECDGADIINVSLPNYPFGLMITQDGYNDDLHQMDGSVAATNLKLVPWERIAYNFPKGQLMVDTSSYNPRQP